MTSTSRFQHSLAAFMAASIAAGAVVVPTTAIAQQQPAPMTKLSSKSLVANLSGISAIVGINTSTVRSLTEHQNLRAESPT